MPDHVTNLLSTLNNANITVSTVINSPFLEGQLWLRRRHLHWLRLLRLLNCYLSSAGTQTPRLPHIIPVSHVISLASSQKFNKLRTVRQENP